MFKGPEYNRELDLERLTTQHEKIFALMSDEQWRTLKEISMATGAPEASVSAQLRYFRRPEFGGYQVNRRKRDDSNSLFEYKLELSQFNLIKTKRKNKYLDTLRTLWLHPDTTKAQRDLILDSLKVTRPNEKV